MFGFPTPFPVSRPPVALVSRPALQSARDVQPVWAKIALQLPPRDPDAEWYAIKDIAPLLGIKERALQYHARQLFPQHEGQFRLSHAQAVRLIRRVCASGRKVPLKAGAR